MTRTLSVLGFLLLSTVSAFSVAPQAVLSSIKGKVEVKLPGTTTWVPAVEGKELAVSAVLSTGFDSSVVVVMGKTTVQVKPLTRMTIEKLAEVGGTLQTSTFLRVGSVSASVKSAEGVKQDFKVQSPYSTASVRGTEFDFDGLKLKVREGLVALALGRPDREAGDDEYVGSPDQDADGTDVFVAAGEEASIQVDFTGNKSTTRGTGDRSEGGKSESSDSGSGHTRTKGSVTVTVTFGS